MLGLCTKLLESKMKFQNLQESKMNKSVLNWNMNRWRSKQQDLDDVVEFQNSDIY